MKLYVSTLTVFNIRVLLINLVMFMKVVSVVEKMKHVFCTVYSSAVCIIQCVPLATEPGISLIILPLMRIFQQNLMWTYLIV